LKKYYGCTSRTSVRSNREIAVAVNIGRATVSDYLRRAKLASLSWPLPAGMTESELEARLFPPASVAKARRTEPNWAAIHREAGRKGVTLDLLWHEYRAQQPDGYQYSAFCQS
jgi:transposase